MKYLVAAVAFLGFSAVTNAASDNPVVNLCGEQVEFKRIGAAAQGVTIEQLVRDSHELDGANRIVVCYQGNLAYVIAHPDSGPLFALSVVAE